MSFSATCWAWSIEGLKSSEKLTLLSFCQYANEEKRIAYPSIDTVAEATGLNKKTVQANIVKLMDKGLMIDTGRRVGKTLSCRVFHMPFQTYKELLEAIPKTGMVANEAIPKTDLSDPNFGQEAIPKTGSKPVIESGNSNQAFCENGKPLSPKQVVDLWNETFKNDYPRKMQEITSARQQTIRARIKNDFKTIDEWKDLFDGIRNSEFLMGQTYSENRKPFQISLDWVCKPDNLANILEGKYHV